MFQWPHDDPKSLAEFYGDPDCGEPGKKLVPVVCPYKLYYAGKAVEHIMFHEKAALALLGVFKIIWAYYDKDQDALDQLRVSHYSGSYNPRKIAGSEKWSNHAYGAAIDFDAEHNSFNTGHGTMPQAVIDAFKSQGALWGGDYQHRTDPMHFEFCSRGNAVVVPVPLPKPKPKVVVAKPAVIVPPKPVVKPPVVHVVPKLIVKTTEDQKIDLALKGLEPK